MSKKQLDRQRVLWVKHSHTKCVEYEKRLLEGEDCVQEAYDYAVFIFSRIENKYPQITREYTLFTGFDEVIREVALFNIVMAKYVAAKAWFIYNITFLRMYVVNIKFVDKKEDKKDDSDELDNA